jgi:hypothetical protein
MRFVRKFVLLYALGVALLFMFGVAFAPNPSGLKTTWNNRWMQTSHSLYLAMFQYSVDNNGNFPDGKSSTEVFQKLMDGGYITDPTIFYISLPGKTEVIGTKLLPENVCWDVTAPVDTNDPDEVPLIFMTGYKIQYVAGGAAVALIKPYPPFSFESRSWLEWMQGKPVPPTPGDSPGLAVAYKNGASMFRKMNPPDGTILNFIAPTFNPKGKTYRQLTPEGSLP